MIKKDKLDILFLRKHGIQVANYHDIWHHTCEVALKNFINRHLNLPKLLAEKSHFLFGPRQTGKTLLIKNTFKKNVQIYSLLNRKTFLDLSQNPSRIRESINDNVKIIVIDEIQKLPGLLDEVHLMIEDFDIHFLLTGSSARSLRRKGVNLLGGRARSIYFHPFSLIELADKFDLHRALSFGLIPSIYLSKNPKKDLRAYAGEYLQEEIAAEALTRNIEAFGRFLQVAAISNGEIINYTKIGNDAQVASRTVIEYFQILKDTLIAHEVPAYKKSIKRKAISTSKFYFFDIGVARSLQELGEISFKSIEIGIAFENYIFHELKSYSDYNSEASICYWRSKSQFEVDFIYDSRIAIEVKAKSNISRSDLKGLKALKEENLLERYLLVSFEETKRIIDKEFEIIPWREFILDLWSGNI